MYRHLRRTAALASLAAMTAVAITGCAALRDIIQPPEFERVVERASQLRLLGPSADRPLGGAELQIWTRVRNPNQFGFTLSTLAGDFLLDGQHAATVDLPLGLPLPAAADTVIPIAFTISFADIPNLANQLLAAITGQSIGYAVHGTVGVDAGPLGQPTFGPETLLTGDVQIIR